MALALGTLVVGVPTFRESATPSLAPNATRPSAAATVINTDSWCPTRAGQTIDELLDGAGLKWKSPYDRSMPARCDLSAKQWLFVVSPGGRTGSTTVLDMINAHPAFGLAGENGGQLQQAMELFKTAAEQPAKFSAGDAWGRGAVDPYNLLCNLAGWFEYVTPPNEKGELTAESLQAHAEAAEKARAERKAAEVSRSVASERHTVLGFKEIRWGDRYGVATKPDTTQNATMLWFLKALFPCHRLVFSERTGDWQSHFADSEKSEGVINHWRHYAEQQPAWHNWWITLKPDGFEKKSFDGMLEWFGEPESGCRSYKRVETANHGESGYNKGAGNLLDASKCQLQVAWENQYSIGHARLE